jgi:hypothetical protein
MKRLYDLGGIITFILLCAFVFGGKAYASDTLRIVIYR